MTGSATSQPACQKNSAIRVWKSTAVPTGIATMRLITITSSVAFLALAAAAPVLARNPDAAKPAAEILPSPCHAYEQNPDGSWREIACAEDGIKPPAPAKISTRNEGKASR
jgi:hypothetical protein